MVHIRFLRLFLFIVHYLRRILYLSILHSQILNYTDMKVFNSLKLFYIRNLINNEKRIKVLFDHHFFTNRYYLHKSASETHMANILNIEIPVLNQVTWQHYNLNFDDMCQKYRFDHFWNEFANPLNADLPIHSMMNFLVLFQIMLRKVKL
jgi:hypothetical protein